MLTDNGKHSAIDKRFERELAEHKSALVEPDFNEIGDKRLNPEEVVAREREKALKAAATRAIPGQKELENPERSAGPRIHWRQLIYRLQKMAPGLRTKDSEVYGKKTIALYWPKTMAEKLNDGSFVLIAASDRDKFHRDHKYVGGFNKEELPFYSHVILDSSRLPVREVRGVATILLMLIRAKVVTFDQVKKEFGDPAEDSRGSRFLEQTTEFRT
jgi:hypothetical protein